MNENLENALYDACFLCNGRPDNYILTIGRNSNGDFVTVRRFDPTANEMEGLEFMCLIQGNIEPIVDGDGIENWVNDLIKENNLNNII